MNHFGTYKGAKPKLVQPSERIIRDEEEDMTIKGG
jgi:hypothetical protein